jgi:hypothetical protein
MAKTVATILIVCLGVFTIFDRCFALEVTVRGAGAFTCDAWTRSRKAASDDMGGALIGSWVIGYLSGKAAGEGRDLLKDTLQKPIEDAMDKQCQSKPSLRVYEAADLVAAGLTH